MGTEQNEKISDNKGGGCGCLILIIILIVLCVRSCSNEVSEPIQQNLNNNEKIKVDNVRKNPYEDFKEYSKKSPEYVWYYLNELFSGNDQFIEKRMRVETEVENIKNTKKEFLTLKLEKPFFGDSYYAITREESNLFYLGEIKNNRPSGIGVLFKDKRNNEMPSLFESSGVQYIGEFQDGMWHGYGQVYHAGQLIYEGYLKKGKYDGKGLKFSYDLDKIVEIVVGHFENDYINGQCKIYMNGILNYDGNVDMNKMEGKGVLYYPSGKMKYNGEFKNNLYSGYGVSYREDGSVEYDGQWKSGDYAN